MPPVSRVPFSFILDTSGSGFGCAYASTDSLSIDMPPASAGSLNSARYARNTFNIQLSTFNFLKPVALLGGWGRRV